eukprot:2043029-Rhodomonas_salina.1
MAKIMTIVIIIIIISSSMRKKSTIMTLSVLLGPRLCLEQAAYIAYALRIAPASSQRGFRERDTQKERQTDRDTDKRQTDRGRQRQGDSEIGRQRETLTETEKQCVRETERQRERERDQPVRVFTPAAKLLSSRQTTRASVAAVRMPPSTPSLTLTLAPLA